MTEKGAISFVLLKVTTSINSLALNKLHLLWRDFLTFSLHDSLKVRSFCYGPLKYHKMQLFGLPNLCKEVFKGSILYLLDPSGAPDPLIGTLAKYLRFRVVFFLQLGCDNSLRVAKLCFILLCLPLGTKS